LTGVGLHSGQTVTVQLRPANEPGIVFIRSDLPGQPRIRLADLWLDGPAFRTTLKRGPAEVHTTEHFLSALAGLGVTDVEVALDGAELPGLDGSPRLYAGALVSAGIATLPGREVEVVYVNEPVSVEENGARVTIEPQSEGLSISYELHYPGEPLAQGRYEVTVTPETYLREIAPARTFCLRREADALLAAGFGKGAGTHNTLVLENGKALDATLRFPDEPVRHKIADLLGDLYLLGRPLRGRVKAERSGHRLNRLLAQRLAGL
jgi:UDP-3-O-acyl N-acetylglucosamine deacetylase